MKRPTSIPSSRPGLRSLVRLVPVCFICAVAAVSACANTPLHTPFHATGDTALILQDAPSHPHASPGPDPVQTPALCWLPLIQRLRADGLDGTDLQLDFIRLGPRRSQVPMGLKITELFKREFMKSSPPPSNKKSRPARPKIYPNIIIPANIERCRNFVNVNAAAFTAAVQRYGVPKEVIVSLLFVETRLGTYLGKDSAFMTLASMAASTTPEHISSALAALPITSERLDWVKQRLRQRSDWAYNELKALIVHARANQLDLLAMPGSIYGAMGLCQFMPSNFKRYAVDGDGDGKINPFEPVDAIMSASNYLHAHGWEKNLTRNGRHDILLRYNKSTIYANTILALADAVNAHSIEKKALVQTDTVPAKAKVVPNSKSRPGKALIR